MRVIRVLAIAFLLSAHAGASSAQGKGKLDPATAAAAARACYEYISGKNPVPTLDKSGFSAGLKNIYGGRNYKKKIRSGLFSSSINVGGSKIEGQNHCTAHTLRPKGSENALLLFAFRKELSSRGNKQTFPKNANGQEWENWFGPIGSYELNAQYLKGFNNGVNQNNFFVVLKPRK